MISNLLVTLSIAAISWSLSLVLSLTIAKASWLHPRLRSFYLGFLIALGLLPVIILGPILRSVSQPEIDLTFLTLFPVEIGLVSLVCSLAIVLSAAKAVQETDTRYGALIRASTLSRADSYREIARPYVVSSVLPALRAAIPLAILLVVLLEWGRGSSDGLGAHTQGVLQRGDWAGRWELIFALSLPSLLAYLAVESFENRWNARYQILLQSEATPQIRATLGLEWFRVLIGLFCGCAAILVFWHIAFSREAIDETQRFTPLKFLLQLRDINDRTILGNASNTSLSTHLLEASKNTIALAIRASAIGVIAAGSIALVAQRYRLAKRLMVIISSISQSVPIFLFIPMFLSLFQEKEIVATLVCVSVTYFAAYEIFLAKLAQIPKEWQDLRTTAEDDRRPLPSFIRTLRFWYIPLMKSMAIVAIVIVLPAGITAAIVADIFLFLGGLAKLAFFEAQTDVFVNLVVVVSIFMLMLCTYILGRFLEQKVRN